MHSSVLISCHLLVWRIAQILRKDASFWASPKKTQLFLLTACSQKAFFTHRKKKWKNAQIFNLRWNDTRGWICNCRFFNLRGCKKMKNKFFKKKEAFFCLGKILLTQTNNLALCLGIYVVICRMPTQIARVPIVFHLIWFLKNLCLNFALKLRSVCLNVIIS